MNFEVKPPSPNCVTLFQKEIQMKVKKMGDRFLTSLTESGFTTTYIRERESKHICI